MAALAEATKAAVEAVDRAVDRKEEADHIRAEVLGQLDSQQERLNQVRASAQSLHNDAARDALLATALAAEAELRACRHEMIVAAGLGDAEAAADAPLVRSSVSRGLDRSSAVLRKMLRFKALMNRRAAATGRRVGMTRQASYRLQSTEKVELNGEQKRRTPCGLTSSFRCKCKARRTAWTSSVSSSPPSTPTARVKSTRLN
jgi:hypothetical protein